MNREIEYPFPIRWMRKILVFIGKFYLTLFWLPLYFIKGDRFLDWCYEKYLVFYKINIGAVMGFFVSSIIFYIIYMVVSVQLIKVVSAVFFSLVLLVLAVSFSLSKLVEFERKKLHDFEDFPEEYEGMKRIGYLKNGTALYYDGDEFMYRMIGFDRGDELVEVERIGFEGRPLKKLKQISGSFGFKKSPEDLEIDLQELVY